MREEEFIQKHDEILNYLLAYKREDENFTFSPRQNHNDLENNHLSCRLCKGFWFQGAEKYIFVALYKRGCKHNKTKTIGFVFEEEKQYIEIVFKKLDNITDDELKFYDELILYLKSRKEIFKEMEGTANKYSFTFVTNELKKNLTYFIREFKNNADELIKKFHLENKYFIAKEELQSRLNEIERIKNTIINTNHSDAKSMNIERNIKNLKIKNIILYGAPGVGKTHNYKKLVALIEGGDFLENKIFDFIINNKDDEIEKGSVDRLFKQVKDEKRVEFITFHQSYSYEDFIEGFRPSKNGNIDLENGIFKLLADRAISNLEDSQKSKNEIKNKYTYENLFNEFKLFIEEKLSTDGVFYLKGKATIINIGKSSFLVGGSVSSGQNLAFNIIERDYDDFKNGKIKSYKDIKSTFESKSGIHGNAPYYFALYEKLKEFEENNYEQTDNEKIEDVERQNFYIVIDEINRGNISKIFGELITLIEEDKRDVYEVTLPYSKEKFKVPSNLYIIATMNSTDKSIATIDIALRRRFTFLKMKPNQDLISHAKAKELFNSLNEFLEKNINEDFKLGHSYFMKIKSDEDLEFVKEYKIKPLLEEYFYADDENFKKAIDILDKDNSDD